MVQVRRVYESAESGDGFRVLVDRLWPRGLSKDKAAIDLWCKDIAPSSALRTWYGHDPARFEEFRRRYAAELAEPTPAAALDGLREQAAARPLTLLTASKAVDLSQATVLADMLNSSGR